MNKKVAESESRELLDSEQFQQQRSSYVTGLSEMVLQATESDHRTEHESNANNTTTSNRNLNTETMTMAASKKKAKKKKSRKTTIATENNVDNSEHDENVEKNSPSRKKKKKKRKNVTNVNMDDENKKSFKSQDNIPTGTGTQTSSDTQRHIVDGDQSDTGHQNVNLNPSQGRLRPSYVAALTEMVLEVTDTKNEDEQNTSNYESETASDTKEENRKIKKKKRKPIKNTGDSRDENGSDTKEGTAPVKKKKRKKSKSSSGVKRDTNNSKISTTETVRSSFGPRISTSNNTTQPVTGAVRVPGINNSNADDNNEWSMSLHNENHDTNPNRDSTVVVADAVTTDDLEDRVLQQLMERMGQTVPATVVEREEAQDTDHQVSQEIIRCTKKRLLIGSCLLCFGICLIIVGALIGHYGSKIIEKDENDDQMGQYDELWQFLNSSYEYGYELANPSSPQFQAYLWLRCGDPFIRNELSKQGRARKKRRLRPFQTQRDISQQNSLQQLNRGIQQRRMEFCDPPENLFPMEGNAKATLLERYALATLLYSTSTNMTDVTNSGWINSSNWLSGKHICKWYLGDWDTNEGQSCDEDNEFVHGLNLTSNNLTGTLPPELTLLQNIKILDVSGNNLDPFPIRDVSDWMRNMTSLTKLNISRNAFSGELHKDFQELINLVEFDVGHNDITGRIPFNYFQWTSIESIHFERNNIEGRMPDDICNLVVNRSAELYADCVDKIHCPCCTYCCQDSGGCQPNER